MSRRGGRGRAGVDALTEAAQPAARVPRRARVEGQLQQILSEALRRMHDPRLLALGVTRVEISDDLQAARIFVRLAFGDDDGATRSRSLKAVNAASGRLRQQVGRSLSLRYTPSLRFFYDEGPDAQRRVDELLAEIRDDEGPDAQRRVDELLPEIRDDED